MPGRLGMGTVATDAAALLSVEGAQTLQAQLAGSADVSPGTRWVVRPGAEIRGSGDVTLARDWVLPSAAVSGDPSAPVQPGGLALTIKAAGDIRLDGGISAGFAAPFDGASPSSWTPTDARAGSVRLQAGGDVVIGRGADAGGFGAPPVLVRSTTGAVSLQAGGDIRLSHGAAAVYTTGVAQVPAGSPDLAFTGQLLGLVETSDGLLSPFLVGGGAVSLQAGGDVLGAVGSAVSPTDWAWRGTDGSYGYRWSRFDRFSGGVASLAGGNLQVLAGGSIIDLATAAADSGWLPMANAAVTDGGTLAAGTVTLRAGADILGGNVWAAGSALTLSAGGRIGAPASGSATDLVGQGGRIRIAARGDLDLDRVQTAGRTATSIANTAGEALVFTGLEAGASLEAASVSGSVSLLGTAGSGEQGESTSFSQVTSTLPGKVRIVAPAGGLSLLGSPTQSVGSEGRLVLLAGGDIRVGNLTVPAGGPPLPPRADAVSSLVDTLARSVFARLDDGALTLDATDRDPVHLASRDGSVVLAGSLQSARPLRLVAGLDLVFAGSGQLGVQHQDRRVDGSEPRPVSELSLLQAGRDITAGATGTAVAGLTAAGPGDLVLLAGRDIDLGAGRGIQAIGNQRNGTLLPEVAMQISALAGYRTGSDLAAAAGLYAATGSLGLNGVLVRDPSTGRGVAGEPPSTVYAFLAGGDAAAFRRLSTAEQISAVRELAGTQFETWLMRWMQAAFALSASPEAARARAQALVPALAGDALAARVMADVSALPAAGQPARVLGWLADPGVRRSLDLGAWLRATLASTLRPANAVAALDGLLAANDPRAAAAVGGVLALALAEAPAERRETYVAMQRERLEASEADRLRAWFDDRLVSEAGFLDRLRDRLSLPSTASADQVRDSWQALPSAQQRMALAAQDLRDWTLDASQVPLEHARGLDAYLLRIGARPGAGSALAAFQALPAERQLPWLAEVLRSDLVAAGEAAAGSGAGAGFDAAYAHAYQAMDLLFPQAARPGTGSGGDIVLPTSQIRTAQAAGITLLAPGGGVNAGALVPGAVSKKANELGIVTVAGGAIVAAVRDDFAVNQSRVFTLEAGDIVLWSSEGNVDAGRGAKTVTGAPAPVLRLDADGNLVLDTSGAFSGSGIAALDATSSVGLFAPRGEVNAGEAGIRSAGNLTVAAAQVRGADNIAVSGQTSGDTGVAAVGATASLAATAQGAGAAVAATATPSDDDDQRRKRRRRNLFLDFLGFGSADN